MAFPGHLKLICEFAILWQWLFESDITLNFFNLFFFYTLVHNGCYNTCDFT